MAIGGTICVGTFCAGSLALGWAWRVGRRGCARRCGGGAAAASPGAWPVLEAPELLAGAAPVLAGPPLAAGVAAPLEAAPLFVAAPAPEPPPCSGTMMLTGGIEAADGTLKPGGTGLAPELDNRGARPRFAQLAACLAT